MFKIVAVTACPTGIAHTYMAAEMLEKEAKKLNIEIIVETNGAIGVENSLSKIDIDQSNAVIIASDIIIDMKRFNGKSLVEVSVSKAIKDAKQLILDAIDGKYSTYKK